MYHSVRHLPIGYWESCAIQLRSNFFSALIICRLQYFFIALKVLSGRARSAYMFASSWADFYKETFHWLLRYYHHYQRNH